MKEQNDPTLIIATHAKNTAGNWQIGQTQQISGWDDFVGQCNEQRFKDAVSNISDRANPGGIVEFERESSITQLTEDEYYDLLNDQLGNDGAVWPEDEDWMMMRR